MKASGVFLPEDNQVILFLGLLNQSGALDVKVGENCIGWEAVADAGEVEVGSKHDRMGGAAGGGGKLVTLSPRHISPFSLRSEQPLWPIKLFGLSRRIQNDRFCMAMGRRGGGQDPRTP